MSSSQSDIQKTISNPLQSKADEMKQTLKAKKSKKKKKENHISIEEDKWESRLIERKRKALQTEEASHL